MCGAQSCPVQTVAATVALLLLLALPPPLPPPLLLLLRSTHLLPRCCASVSCSFLSSCSNSFRNCTAGHATQLREAASSDCKQRNWYGCLASTWLLDCWPLQQLWRSRLA